MGKYLRTCIPLMLLVLLVSASAYAGGVTAAALQKAGWDCTTPIAGNVHCTPPGEPTLGDLIMGAAAPATLYLTNFSADGNTLAGTELLIRADLYHGQLCETDPIGPPLT